MRKRESGETKKPFSQVNERLEPRCGVEKGANQASYESERATR